jgi:hypothetical protein
MLRRECSLMANKRWQVRVSRLLTRSYETNKIQSLLNVTVRSLRLSLAVGSQTFGSREDLWYSSIAECEVISPILEVILLVES